MLALVLALAEALEKPLEEAAEVIAQYPTVLRASPKTITATNAALMDLPGLEGMALALCRGHPTVLGMSALSLTEKWLSLQHILEQRPNWCLELQEWQQDVAKLHNVLILSVRNHQRLEFLCDGCNCNAELVSTRSAYTWLTMAHSRFDKLVPGYLAWTSENRVS